MLTAALAAAAYFAHPWAMQQSKGRCLPILLFVIGGLGSCHPSQQLCENSDWAWTAGHPIYDGAVDSLRLHRSGQITLDGRDIDEVELKQRLTLSGEMPVVPEVLLRHDAGVPCWEVVEMRTLMRQTLKCDGVDACHEGREWDWIPETGLSGGF